jgi:prepilin-type N-terminal cleavage/methylation domain-containing protein
MTKANTRGFSLVEVLAAVAIFGVGLAAIFTAFGNSAQQLEHQRHTTHSIHLTEAKLEEILLWSNSDADLVVGGSYGPTWFTAEGIVSPGATCADTAGLPPTTPDCRYRVTWTVTAGGIDGVRVVTVTTAWNERGVLRTTSFSTQRN